MAELLETSNYGRNVVTTENTIISTVYVEHEKIMHVHLSAAAVTCMTYICII